MIGFFTAHNSNKYNNSSIFNAASESTHVPQCTYAIGCMLTFNNLFFNAREYLHFIISTLTKKYQCLDSTHFHNLSNWKQILSFVNKAMIDVPQEDNAITSYKEGDTTDLSQFLTYNFKSRNKSMHDMSVIRQNYLNWHNYLNCSMT